MTEFSEQIYSSTYIVLIERLCVSPTRTSHLIVFIIIFNELLSFLDNATLPFNAVSTMISQAALWSVLCSHFDIPDLQSCLHECMQSSI